MTQSNQKDAEKAEKVENTTRKDAHWSIYKGKYYEYLKIK